MDSAHDQAPAPSAPGGRTVPAGTHGLAALQQEVDRLIRRFPEGYWPPLANLARLTEETGELARAVNQTSGSKRRKPGEEPGDVPLEMGDVLFTLCVLANQFSVDLDEAIALTLEKVRSRDLDRI